MQIHCPPWISSWDFCEQDLSHCKQKLEGGKKIKNCAQSTLPDVGSVQARFKHSVKHLVTEDNLKIIIYPKS